MIYIHTYIHTWSCLVTYGWIWVNTVDQTFYGLKTLKLTDQKALIKPTMNSNRIVWVVLFLNPMVKTPSTLARLKRV